MAGDVLNYGMFISIATAALAVIIANQSNKSNNPRVGAATYQGFLEGDSVRFYRRTADSELQNDLQDSYR